jgi:capsular exopolysaccharide synthesis family protein
MDLHQYLQAVRRFWPVILLPALVFGAYGLYSASNVVTQHRASVTFFIGTSGDDTASGAVQGDEFAQRRVNSYIALATTDRLATMVAESPGIDLEPAQVKRMLGATGDLDTVLLTTRVTSTDPELARQVAEAVATEFVVLVDEVETSGDSPASVSLEVVSGPSVSEVPTRGKLTTVVLTMVGLLIGLGLAVLLELRDNAVRTEEQLRALDPGPLLGRIPFDRRVRTIPLIVDADHRSVMAESFRQLRTNLEFIDIEHPVKVLVVTSSVPEEGKSVVASNLAVSLTLGHRSVLLIEADLRRPSLADHFGIDRSRGLTDVIAGRASLDSVLHTWVTDGLAILPSGPLPPNPSELLGSTAMLALLDELRERFDVIVIDTPPLLPVTDGAVAAAWADGVLLVVRSGKATRHQVTHSLRALQAVSGRVLGVVLTMAPATRAAGYETYGTRPADGPTSLLDRVSGAVEDLRQRVSESVRSRAAEPLDPGPDEAGPVDAGAPDVEADPEPVEAATHAPTHAPTHASGDVAAGAPAERFVRLARDDDRDRPATSVRAPEPAPAPERRPDPRPGHQTEHRPAPHGDRREEAPSAGSPTGQAPAGSDRSGPSSSAPAPSTAAEPARATEPSPTSGPSGGGPAPLGG